MAAALVRQCASCRGLWEKSKCINKVFRFQNLQYASAYSTKVERQMRRQELITEFKKGSYFADIREYQRTGGKRFSAPENLVPAENAVVFPAFSATALSGRSVNLEEEFKDNVTLLLIAMRGIAQPMCDQYRKAFQEDFHGIKGANYFEVNVVEYWFYGLFRGFISRALKNAIPKDRHDNFLCLYSSLKQLRSRELLGNIVVGHAFLIDRNGLVRWKACAEPTGDELVSLSKCTKQLIP